MHWWLFLGGFPEWRAWPFIVFGALGAFFLAGVFDGGFLLGIAFLSMAVLSFWVLKPDMSNPLSKEEEVSNIEEIRCPQCQHRLRIPRNHTGLAGCPACMMKILLKDGEISD